MPDFLAPFLSLSGRQLISMKIWLITLAVGAFTILLSCVAEKPEESPKITTTVQSPNEDSELALLMRFMYDDMYRVKSELEAGKRASLEHDPKEMFTAEPTDSAQVSTESYKAFGQAYIAAYNTFHQAEQANLKEHFEVLVHSCMTCHQTTCPGPMRRIQNLYFDN